MDSQPTYRVLVCDLRKAVSVWSYVSDITTSKQAEAEAEERMMQVRLSLPDVASCRK
jgi:hypothetical protein